jgi:hypothetical protein
MTKETEGMPDENSEPCCAKEAECQDTASEVPHMSGFERIFKKMGPVAIKTLLDPDAMRRVFSRIAQDNESKLDAHLSAPGEFRPKKRVTDYRKASPCSSVWDGTPGSERVRYCEQCRLQVYDFSAMDDAEAKEYVFKREEISEPTFYRRKDGKFLTSNCLVGAKREFNQMLVLSGGAVLVIVLIVAFVMMPPPPVTKPVLTAASEGSTREQPTSKVVSAAQTHGSKVNFDNDESDEEDADFRTLLRNPRYQQQAARVRQEAAAFQQDSAQSRNDGGIQISRPGQRFSE